MTDGARDRALRVALTLWVAFFIAFLGTTVTTFHEPLRVAAFWAYAVPIVLAAAWHLARRVTPLDASVLIALGCLLTVSWLSRDRLASVESSGLAVAYASTFVVAARATSATWRSAIAIGITLTASIWMLVFAVVWIGDRIEWVVLGGGIPPHIAQSAHMWLGTDLVAVLLLLAVPFYVWVRWIALRRILVGVTTVAAFAVVPMSDARTTWIAAVVGVVGFVALTPHSRHWIWPGHRVAVLAGGGLMLLAGIAVALSGTAGTLSGRTHIWTTAVATFASSPVSGTGPGTFSWARLAATPAFLEPFPVFQAHNIVLQTLADGGLILLIGLTAALGAWLATVGPAMLSLGSRTRLALAVLVAFAIVALFDDPMQLPALSAMALILAGWVAADSSPGHGARQSHAWVRWMAAGAMLAAGVVTVPSVFAASEARTAAAEGRSAAVAADWESALEAFNRAAEQWPSRAPYHLGLGLASAELGDARQARGHYETAAHLSPGDPRPVAALAAMTGDANDRVTLLERAARFTSRDPQYRYRLAIELAEAGRERDAIHEIARAAVIDPQILTTIEPEWDSASLDAVIEAIPHVLAAEADLMALDPADVMAQVDVIVERINGSNPPSLVALAASRIGDQRGAAEWMERAFELEPFEQRTYDVGMAIAETRCHQAEARRMQALGEIAPGAFTSLYRIGPEVVEARDHVYREMGLGDYQPPGVRRPDVSPYEWPRAFLTGIGCVAAGALE